MICVPNKSDPPPRRLLELYARAVVQYACVHQYAPKLEPRAMLVRAVAWYRKGRPAPLGVRL